MDGVSKFGIKVGACGWMYAPNYTLLYIPEDEKAFKVQY